MRNEKEKKSIVKSIKISPLQEQQIMEQAEQKVCEFEGLCTPITPQEKYNKLENSMSLFVEGEYKVWEYLK